MHPDSLCFPLKDPCPLLMNQMKGKQRMPLPLAAGPGLSPPRPPQRPPQRPLPQTQQKLSAPPSPRSRPPGLCPLLPPASTPPLPRASLTRSLPSSPLSRPLNQLTEIATLSSLNCPKQSPAAHCYPNRPHPYHRREAFHQPPYPLRSLPPQEHHRAIREKGTHALRALNRC